MLKALIFDMDGVIIDSMPYHADAWKTVFNDVGVNITKQDIFDIEGSNHETVIDLMFRKVGKIPNRSEFDVLARKKSDIFKAIAKLQTFDGIPQCLKILRNRYSLAVVSGSDRIVVQEIIDEFFPGVFDVLVSGEDVHIGKPDPEPYLKAVKMLGFKKIECIAIENAPLGVKSAKSAGLFCAAIPTYVEPELLKEADMVLPDHAALIEYLLGLQYIQLN